SSGPGHWCPLRDREHWNRTRPVHRRTSDRAAQLALGVLPQRPAQCDRHLLLPSMAALDATIANIVYTVTFLSTTIYLQDGRGLSPIVAGVVFLAPSVAVALSGPIAGRLARWQPGPRLTPAALLLGGVSPLLTSATDTWGAYLPLLGLTGFAFGLGWTLPSIGTQTAVDPARAGEAAGVDLAVMVTIAGVAVAVAGTLIELGAAGTGDITDATTWVMRLVSVRSLVGGALLVAITRA